MARDLAAELWDGYANALLSFQRFARTGSGASTSINAICTFIGRLTRSVR